MTVDTDCGKRTLAPGETRSESARGLARAVFLAVALGAALTAAALTRSPLAAIAVGVLLAAGAAAWWVNPSLRAMTFYAFVGVLVTAVPGPNLRPPGAPDAIFAYRVLLAVFVALLGARLALRGGKSGTRLGRKSQAIIWLPILGWAALSLLWVEDVAAGLRYCAFLATGVLLLYSLREYGREPRQLRAMVLACAVVAAAVILFGVFERATNIHLPESSRLAKISGERYRWMVTSVFHNPNEFATYIGLCFPLLAVAVIGSRRLSRQLVAAALCAAAGYCLLSTGSRANLIAVGLGSMVLAGLSSVRRPIRILLLFTLTLLVGQQVLQTVTSGASLQQLGALNVTSVLSERAAPRGQLVKDGLAMLAATKGAGVGAGNVELHMARLGRQKQNVHNWWLEMLVNLGVVCFALYLGFYVTTLLGLYRVYRASRDPYLQGLSLGLFAGLVGFTVGCLSSSSLIAWPPMWIYFGLCLAVIEAHVAAQRTPADAPPSDFASLPHSG